MNSPPSEPASAASRIPFVSRIFLFSASWVLLCIPCILIAEGQRFPQWPFHMSQMLMSLVCCVTAFVTWRQHRTVVPIWLRRLSLLGVILTCLWLTFILAIIGLMVAFPIDD
jgi:hypothetical protein